MTKTTQTCVSDLELVLHYQVEHDNLSVGELYQRYYPRVYKYCLSILKDPNDAGDIAQDVFLRAMEKINDLKNPVTFTAWLFRISRNACVDRCKHRGLHRHEPTESDCNLAIEDVDLEFFWEKEHQYEQINTLLTHLSEESRQLLQLKYLENKSIEELQALFNLGESAVKMRLARARNRIIKLYQKGQKYNPL